MDLTAVSGDARFGVGVAEFNAGHFFEAHEVWEEQWNDLLGDERSFVQGLIQIAAGYLKLELGNRDAARKLWTKGLDRSRAVAADEATGWRQFFAAVAGDLDALSRGAVITPPRIDLNPVSSGGSR